MRNQNIAEDGYGPSEDEDDDYYGKFASRKVTWSDNFTGKRKKKRRKRGNTKFQEKGCDFQENFQDPLVVFGWDIMSMIPSHLDARTVALSLIVSCSRHGVASSNALCSKKLIPRGHLIHWCTSWVSIQLRRVRIRSGQVLLHLLERRIREGGAARPERGRGALICIWFNKYVLV